MEAFYQGIYARVTDSLKIETIRVELIRLIGGGESAWAAVESLCTAEGKHGELMTIIRQSYAWGKAPLIFTPVYIRQTISFGVRGLSPVQLAGKNCSD